MTTPIPVVPSRRQMIAKSIECLIASGTIVTSETDDDMLWCVVNMRQPPELVQAAIRLVAMSWGTPIPISLGEHDAIYLFSMLEGRIRDRIN